MGRIFAKQNISGTIRLRNALVFVVFLALALVLLGMTFLEAKQDPYEESYCLPPKAIQDLLNRDRHYDMLTNMSPDGDHFLIPVEAEFSSLELMTQKTYRLAMLEFCPDVNREWRLSTSGIKGLKIYSLKQRKIWNVQLPPDIFVSDMIWSPDGEKIAFLAHLKEGSQVWTANVSNGEAKPLNKAYVMATLAGRPQRRGPSSVPSRMLQWTPDGSVLALLVPQDRGLEPAEHPIPSSPLIRSTREKPTPTPTYPFLLRTPRDKALFRFYTTSQLALLSEGKPPRKIGQPAMCMSISLSPDGKYILAENLTEPFSYIVSFNGFPREIKVLDLEGHVLSTICKIPLQEAEPRRRGESIEDDFPREVTWRPDGKGLTFLWKEKKKENNQASAPEENDAERLDRLMWLAYPFDMDKPHVLASSKKRFSQVVYSPEGQYVFATLKGKGEEKKSTLDIVAYDLNQKKIRQYFLVKAIDPEDVLALPGEIVTRSTGNGTVYALCPNDRKSVYLEGRGYKENFQQQPFIDRVSIETGTKERIFEGSTEMYERPLVPLDNDMVQIVISRESKTVFPESYLWSRKGPLVKLTDNRDPFPEVAGCEKVDFSFTRRDGLILQGRILLPVDYKKGTRVPAVFWTYPQEYKSFEDYKKDFIRSHNRNAFPHLNYRNASEIWLTQGYAVVEPDIAIIGKENLYNNNYISHLVDSMYAAIRKVDAMGFVDIDHLGHGGHSYGAFATANILAHTPFFKAGIAGDGAYNRTLTPMTFQNEQRFLWEAQETYLEMSPFFQADHIDSPLLMYHGAADNNSGTFLIQSERLIQALTGLGKKAVLYIYPFESHGPRCKETYMDMWTRWLSWFDIYVKGADTEIKEDK